MRGFSVVALYEPKNFLNIGSTMRAAGCFEAALVVCIGERFNNLKKHLRTDPQKIHRHIPLQYMHKIDDMNFFEAKLIGVEISDKAKDIVTFNHPESAIYLFGPEDGSIPRHILDMCDEVVSVPTKYCLNLSATVNVVLYDRKAKQSIKNAD